MLQLKNNTPFIATMALFPNEDAIDTLYVMAKATFTMGHELMLSEEQSNLITSDIYWAEPGTSSIKHASDMHIGKPSSDIIMLGQAYAPNNQAVTKLDVSLSVGKVNKTIRVFGDRQWWDGRITQPAPFTSMAMVYENAFGGSHIVDDQIAASDNRNPLGQGFAGARSADEMSGVHLPNLEDPSHLIHSHTDQPQPVCFAACAPNWQPRASFAGTYDEQWQSTRAPYLPEDFNKRFLNVAHPDLIYPGYLQGGEPVHILNMHPAGPLYFEVPRVGLRARVMIAGSEITPEFNLETLTLEPNELCMSLTWRAAVTCDKKALKISKIEISLLQ